MLPGHRQRRPVAPFARCAPSKTREAARAIDELEARLAKDLLPEALYGDWRQAELSESLEAKIVRSADKIQMMIKVLSYERQHRGRLDEFWENPKNFRDMGLPLAKRVFARIVERAGRTA